MVSLQQGLISVVKLVTLSESQKSSVSSGEITPIIPHIIPMQSSPSLSFSGYPSLISSTLPIFMTLFHCAVYSHPLHLLVSKNSLTSFSGSRSEKWMLIAELREVKPFYLTNLCIIWNYKPARPQADKHVKHAGDWKAKPCQEKACLSNRKKAEWKIYCNSPEPIMLVTKISPTCCIKNIM